METSTNPDISSPAQPANDPDVVITRTEFVEPGRPTALANCSAKGELLQPHRVNLDLTDYVSQVHKSRDAEIGMVNQIQQKSEVPLFFLLVYCIAILLFLPCSSPQVYYL